jgi:hypothetical protein
VIEQRLRVVGAVPDRGQADAAELFDRGQHVQHNPHLVGAIEAELATLGRGKHARAAERRQLWSLEVIGGQVVLGLAAQSATR